MYSDQPARGHGEPGAGAPVAGTPGAGAPGAGAPGAGAAGAGAPVASAPARRRRLGLQVAFAAVAASVTAAGMIMTCLLVSAPLEAVPARGSQLPGTGQSAANTWTRACRPGPAGAVWSGNREGLLPSRAIPRPSRKGLSDDSSRRSCPMARALSDTRRSAGGPGRDRRPPPASAPDRGEPRMRTARRQLLRPGHPNSPARSDPPLTRVRKSDRRRPSGAAAPTARRIGCGPGAQPPPCRRTP
jgi:hypothetical protein